MKLAEGDRKFFYDLWQQQFQWMQDDRWVRYEKHLDKGRVLYYFYDKDGVCHLPDPNYNKGVENK